MTNKQKWAFLVFVVICGWMGKTIAQQQYSGGQAVTVTSGTVASTQSGTWTVQPGNTANTTAWKVDGSAVTQPTSLASLPALTAGTAKVGVTYPYTSCATTAFTTALQAMPTVSTAITATTTCLLTLQVSNTSGGSLTVTVSDNAGTPINFLNAVTVLSGETREYSFPNGMKFTSGIKVAASNTGITYAVEGLQ